ncbi:unnamed protein product [Caretta caretta]
MPWCTEALNAHNNLEGFICSNFQRHLCASMCVIPDKVFSTLCRRLSVGMLEQGEMSLMSKGSGCFREETKRWDVC